jgi:hypothetical protein
MVRVVPVRVLDDNYAYLIIDDVEKQAAAVDPVGKARILGFPYRQQPTNPWYRMSCFVGRLVSVARDITGVSSKVIYAPNRDPPRFIDAPERSLHVALPHQTVPHSRAYGTEGNCLSLCTM